MSSSAALFDGSAVMYEYCISATEATRISSLSSRPLSPCTHKMNHQALSPFLFLALLSDFPHLGLHVETKAVNFILARGRLPYGSSLDLIIEGSKVVAFNNLRRASHR